MSWGHDTERPDASTPFRADLQEPLLQTHTWTARATQVSPDRATLVLFILFMHTCPHLPPHACLLLQNIILARTEAPSQNLTRQVRFHGQHLVQHSGSLKKQTEQKCITYEISWVSYLPLKKKIFSIKIF